MTFAVVSVTGSAAGSTTGSGAMGDAGFAGTASFSAAGAAFELLLGLDLFAAAVVFEALVFARPLALGADAATVGVAVALVGSADALADASEAFVDEAEALAVATDALVGVADALAGAAGAVGAAAAAAAGFGLVSLSLGLAVGPFASGLGSIGAPALRLAEAVVFFVVVGFFAIAAHLGDLSASNKECG